MKEHNERVLVTLIGGPCDGYDDIDVHNLDEAIEPSGHHLRELTLARQPRYERVSSGRYQFAGYVE